MIFGRDGGWEQGSGTGGRLRGLREEGWGSLGGLWRLECEYEICKGNVLGDFKLLDMLFLISMVPSSEH